MSAVKPQRRGGISRNGLVSPRRGGWQPRQLHPGTRIIHYRCCLPALAGFANYRRERTNGAAIRRRETTTSVNTGGESGIRTREAGISRLHTFQACSFNHSDTSPRLGKGCAEYITMQARTSFLGFCAYLYTSVAARCSLLHSPYRHSPALPRLKIASPMRPQTRPCSTRR